MNSAARICSDAFGARASEFSTECLNCDQSRSIADIVVRINFQIRKNSEIMNAIGTSNQKTSNEVDVLLVYPIWVTSSGRGRLQRMLPPLGVLSIASYLETSGYKVKVIDLHAEAITPEEFRKIIKMCRPRYVGITVLSSHFLPAQHIAKIVKEELPETYVVVGGVHAEAHPEQMLQNKNIDLVCRGDGEEVMLEIIQGKAVSEIKGLSFLNGKKEVVHNPPRELADTLDRYPLPAYHLINFKNYFPGVGTYRNFPAINALMTRGCPGKCTFCNSAKTLLRGRSPEKMVELVQHLNVRHGIKQISFYDDTFTANPKNVREFCRLMIEKKVDVTFVCYVRGDMFSEELAKLLSRAGCHQILLGIESGSSSLMAKIGKPIDKEKYKKVVKIAHQNGIEVRGSFIIGHLDETKETLEETLQFAKDLNLDFFQPNILTPYPGTQLYKDAKAHNLLLHENYDMYGQGEVVLKMKNLTEKDLLAFYYWCFLRFYFRPKAIWQQLKRLRHWVQLKDLVQTFSVLIIEGVRKDRSGRLKAWLDFNLQEDLGPDVMVPNSTRLTWEVRQMENFE